MKPSTSNRRQVIITGLRKKLVRLRVGLHMARLVYGMYRDPVKCITVLRGLARHRKEYAGKKIQKMVRVGRKYYWDLYIPGYPSLAFDRFIEGEAGRIFPAARRTNRFTNIIMAITKRCPLRCEHCFEWEALNELETLTLPDIKRLVGRFQELGTGQIQLTGGEPMVRPEDLGGILDSARPGTEFWVFTSGYNLTPENARKLKDAGLTGVVVSLDHFDPEMHNHFRGSAHSFDWAATAVQNAIGCGLVTALSLCTTKTFVTLPNLMAYAELAKTMGVSFIQLLEPRAAGRYSGKDVALSDGQLKVLEAFYWNINYGKNFRDYPLICYHGHYQRKTGCFAAGNRTLYVDTDGYLHACPYCRARGGYALSGELSASIEQLVQAGCHAFETSIF
jgi:MoaA/NifB/PqqE/SkfB family radical SAM enzyme